RWRGSTPASGSSSSGPSPKVLSWCSIAASNGRATPIGPASTSSDWTNAARSSNTGTCCSASLPEPPTTIRCSRLPQPLLSKTRDGERRQVQRWRAVQDQAGDDLAHQRAKQDTVPVQACRVIQARQGPGADDRQIVRCAGT